jgi:F0F1-type ATP synthase assembly protein I
VSDKKPNTIYAKAGAYMGLAMVIPAAMFAGHWIGGHADKSMGTGYWSIVGLMVGFAAGLYEVMRQATRIEKIGKDR